MKTLRLLVLMLGACGADPPVPCADMRANDASIVLRDLATGYPDLLGPDMATECIKCNAIINPCPARGLYCDGRTGCCDSNPH